MANRQTVDLRSDTVTQPTVAMRAAMARARVGDDVYGEDPTVNALEARVAALTGKEAALLVPSGTQGNLVALLTHCRRGDAYIVGAHYHSYCHEAGGGAALGGIQPQAVPVQADGALAAADIAAAINPHDQHFARSRLLALENTHRGQAMPVGFVDEAAQLAHEHGLRVHLDGARLFNAAVAGGATLAALTAPVDTASICFSKGLGTPFGSVVVGPDDWIREARHWRKMVGGGLRQAGIIAAAIDHALDHHVDRLGDDHRRARDLAAGIAAIPGVVDVNAATNMVHMEVATAAIGHALSNALQADGVRIAGGRHIRLVTHRDIDDAAIATALQAFQRWLPALAH